jgi:hypothetical protein
MANKNFVGTLGCFAWDSDGHLGVVSNLHVLGDSGNATPGHPFGQPFGANPADRVGVLTRFVPYSRQAPNLVDAAFCRLDSTTALTGYAGALGGAIKGVRSVTPADLGKQVVKGGRTTGASIGTIRATELDGLPVATPGGVTYWNDQIEVTGGANADFSAGGDSGSMVLTTDGWAIGLLFAGGHDGTEDRTYAGSLKTALAALGVTLAL